MSAADSDGIGAAAPPAQSVAFLRPPRALVSSVLAVLLALLVGAGLIAAWGVNPVKAYATLIDGAFGNRNSIAETLLRSVPLTFAGLGVAIAFRGGAFNVGAEGQLFVGATAATFVGTSLAGASPPLVLAIMVATAFVAGAVWSGIAGLLKLGFGASELITTIMLNYVAIYLVSYLLHGPLQDPDSYLPQTVPLARSISPPILIAKTRLHAGFLFGLAAVLLAHLALWHTTFGFRLRVVGLNPRAALNAGIGATGVTLAAFLLSGGLAGLAGLMEVVGVQHRMIENLSPGYGYTAIIVALLGQTNPIGVLAAAILFAALQVGATTMESGAGVPSTLTTILQGLVVLFVIGHGAFDLLRRRRSSRPALATAA
jgi:general nucleoside transport system permease protein